MRNPQRTGSSAAALMIGLALVTLVTMLAASIRASFFGAVNKIFIADYAVTAQNNFDLIPAAIGIRCARRPACTTSSASASARRALFGAKHRSPPSTPAASKIFNLDWTAGSPAVLDTLGPTAPSPTRTTRRSTTSRSARRSRSSFRTASGPPFTIKGIFDPPAGGSPFGGAHDLERHVRQALHAAAEPVRLLQHDGGESDANNATLDQALTGFPNAKVQDREEFKNNQASFLGNILNILYVLLALSVIVSLFGIVNTLVLTIFERTRELGMLRAVGMTRWQMRSMITLESVVTALIGAVIGIVLGIVLSVLLIVRVDFLVLSLADRHRCSSSRSSRSSRGSSPRSSRPGGRPG